MAFESARVESAWGTKPAPVKISSAKKFYFPDCCLNKQNQSYEDKAHFNNSFLLSPFVQWDVRPHCLLLASPAFQEIEEATQSLPMQNVETNPFQLPRPLHRKATDA